MALSLEMAQCLRDQEEEEDDDCMLVARKRGSTGALKSAKPVAADAFQQKGELVEQLREELKIKEAETLGWRQGMDNLTSEKETLREQLTSLEHQFQRVKEESRARVHEIEELKAKSVAELAKAKSDTEEIISSYRADAEATNARPKEMFTTAETKTSEEEASIFLSNEEDSASGSNSGGDEDEGLEGEALEDAAPEGDATAEDAAPE
ncbi:uncharacterized protein [Nicotiana sylvestris]|uniref:uncharacterized protein n=1 Tax=Nicotiana sylvestris TaxID=4096 RepID=UPI00388C906F